MTRIEIVNVDPTETLVLQTTDTEHPLPHRVVGKLGYGCVTYDAEGNFVSYTPTTILSENRQTTYEDFLAAKD